MEKEGKIKLIAADGITGIITEDNTNQDFEFIHPGANVEFVEGDQVTFIMVTTPSGIVIARGIKKKPVGVDA